MLDRNNEDTQLDLVPNEVQGDFILSSSSVSSPCTSLGVKTQDEIEIEIAKKLSEILFNKYLIWKQKQKTPTNTEELVHQNN